MSPRWSLKQLRLVSLAAAGGSFARAAQDMGLSPPAVTAQMKALEEELGLPVFERIGGRLRPTAAGRELVEAYGRVAKALAEAERAMEAIRSPDRGSVVVGAVSTAKYFAPMVLAAFRDRHPAIEMKLVVGNRAEIAAGMEGLDFDLAIMGRPPAGMDAETAVIGPHPHVVIAPPGHPLLRRRALTPADLAREDFLVREEGSGTRQLMARLFDAAGVQPRIAMEIGSNETIKQAVMAGLGLSFISAHTVAAEVADGRLAVLEAEGLPVERQWLVVRNRDKRLMPAARTLEAFLAREGSRYLPKAAPPASPAAPPASPAAPPVSPTAAPRPRTLRRRPAP